jgi:methylated-DNA-[protein]-cysteine S-methyltransferase
LHRLPDLKKIRRISVMEYIRHISSPLGEILLSGTDQALTGLWFEGQKYYASTLTGPYEEGNPDVFAQTEKWLDLYFSGKIPDFTPPLAPSGTAFRKEVWEILLTIPFGRTMTYGEIAGLLARRKGLSSMSAKAVGGAVSRNPISIIIPCNRVIGAGGGLTGYAGGLERKEKLLALEKAGCISISSLF